MYVLLLLLCFSSDHGGTSVHRFLADTFVCFFAGRRALSWRVVHWTVPGGNKLSSSHPHGRHLQHHVVRRLLLGVRCCAAWLGLLVARHANTPTHCSCLFRSRAYPRRRFHDIGVVVSTEGRAMANYHQAGLTYWCDECRACCLLLAVTTPGRCHVTRSTNIDACPCGRCLRCVCHTQTGRPTSTYSGIRVGVAVKKRRARIQP